MNLNEIKQLSEDELKNLLLELASHHLNVCEICGCVRSDICTISCSDEDGGHILCTSCPECTAVIEHEIENLKS